jgi:hypothetical protein
MFYYPCPCGDKFQISVDELLDGEGTAVVSAPHNRRAHVLREERRGCSLHEDCVHCASLHSSCRQRFLISDVDAD